MNYRSFYEKKTNLKLPNSFDVHHIDTDRSNNELINLVAIPKELHIRYHKALNDLNLISLNDLMPVGDINGGNKAFYYKTELLNKYCDLLLEMNTWINYRDYLLGNFPSINRIKNYLKP